MALSLKCLEEKLKKAIRDYKDFPKPGVIFRDLLPIMQDAHLMNELLDCLVSESRKRCGKINAVVALEARGFLFGPLIALRMGLPFVPIRKPGKLPGKIASAAYLKEYGEDTLEVQVDALQEGSFVLLFDDVLATGGICFLIIKICTTFIAVYKRLNILFVKAVCCSDRKRYLLLWPMTRLMERSVITSENEANECASTAAAAVRLLNSIGVQVAYAFFLAELLYLQGAQFLKGTPYLSLLQFDS
ncbi:adenine phosphoribosyltransferase [Trichuris trichiura]|uniref:adenine phosphoribosyltransferase n=1 Tax=Trichuris trichiura TaxID=36087 RepID=A0A077Z6K4_TRITR|nr:adenine phosphoribosyltransferase [Trichuris trichiura]